MSALASRKGAAAQLAAGAWDGLRAMIHGPALGGQYGKAPLPMSMIYLMRTTTRWVDDKHSNKWWRHRESGILKLLEDEELRKLSTKLAPKCQPLPWAEFPVAEALS